MAVTKEIWVDYIIGNLFKGNPHLESGRCFDESDQVLNGKVVHINQAGSTPQTFKNPTQFPLVAVKRADSDIIYALDNYVTNPTHIENVEKVEIAYDKMESVLGEHLETLRQLMGDDILYKWVKTYTDQNAAATILRTTGGAVASHLGTGNKLKFLKEDLKRARLRMNRDSISREGRFALIPSDMLDQLTDDSDLKVRDSALELDMRSGTIGRLYGFEILERASTLRFTNDATPVAKALEAANADTDNDSVICWQANAVARAQGEVNFYENLDDALYQGDVYSANVRMGGRSRRADSKGLVVIAQATA